MNPFCCRKASRLLSEREDRKLSIVEKFSLRFHLSMCKLCVHLENQVQCLRKFSEVYSVNLIEDGVEGPKLSAEASDRIKEMIQNNDKGL